MNRDHESSLATVGTSRPLQDHVLHITSPGELGLATTAAVLTGHLTRLGATVATHEPPGPGSTDADADALRVSLHGPNSGSGVRASVHGWGGLGSGPFSEATAQARLGAAVVHGRAGGTPRLLGLDYLSTVGGLVAAQGTLAVLFGERRGIRWDAVETSVAHAALFTVGQYVAAATAAEDPETEPDGVTEDTAAPPFTSADGIVFEIETLSAQPWLDFWDALGADRAAIGASWRPFLGRYAHAVAPLAKDLHRTTGRHTYDRIREHAERAGLSVCPLRTLHERRSDDDVRRDAPPWEFRTAPGAPEPTRRRPAGTGPGPLSGIRVVESTRRIQGPLASRLLGLLGAEVVRIEPPGGDPLRGIPPMAGDCSARFTVLNHGKRVEEIDFTGPAGREAVRELVTDADVFLHNWAPGKAAELGLDHSDLAEVNPDLVYARASAWGRDPSGPRPLGTDFVVQAWSGVADALSTDGPRRAGSLMTLLDLLGGHLAAEGVLAALLARERGARALRVDTSLLAAANVLLGDRFRPARTAAPAPGLLLPTADGTLAVGADLSTVAAQLPGSRTADDVPALLRTADAGYWSALLTGRGIPATVLCTDVGLLPADPLLAAAYTTDGCALPVSPWRFS
ncbi:CoA transferase [Pseudonocardia sp. NPDC049635]|uniref:CoA transferase n=1 Tax=Pseudonocardia sp. NPDC049635 TaxID=3155506 RepID=UPI0033F61916